MTTTIQIPELSPRSIRDALAGVIGRQLADDCLIDLASDCRTGKAKFDGRVVARFRIEGVTRG